MDSYFKKIFIKRSNALKIQFLRYSLVGGVAALIDISVFYTLAKSFEVNHLAANTVSFTLGLITNYLMSRSWVFNSSRDKNLADFLIFSMIGVAGLILSSLILYLLIDLGAIYAVTRGYTASGLKLPELAGKIIAVAVVFFWNFFARKIMVFRKPAV